ncbi:MAG: TIGR02452 family protein [Bacteroidetes bacterium]|nr:MAG: TIGR02452 family protein [Bacteroidota bacterium]
MKQSERVTAAKNTLEIIKNGFYHNQYQEQIKLEIEIENAIKNSTLFKENEFENLFLERDKLFLTQNIVQTNIKVTTETTLEACKRIYANDKKIFCLNFASAKNEGGGFLGGAQAQEESLARSSALYPCLTKFHHDFYHLHKEQKNSYYTSNMIFSSDVPVFKDDDGILLDNFYSVSFLTSPAVNVGSLKQNQLLKNDSQKYDEEKYEKLMLQRLENLLTIAYVYGYESLVLGAWGCGVFQNDPKKVAQLFASLLTKNNAIFKNRFKNIVFAIYTSGNKTDNLVPFQQTFG